jgi:hypothetical protein
MGLWSYHVLPAITAIFIVANWCAIYVVEKVGILSLASTLYLIICIILSAGAIPVLVLVICLAMYGSYLGNDRSGTWLFAGYMITFVLANASFCAMILCGKSTMSAALGVVGTAGYSSVMLIYCAVVGVSLLAMPYRTPDLDTLFGFWMPLQLLSVTAAWCCHAVLGESIDRVLRAKQLSQSEQ